MKMRTGILKAVVLTAIIFLSCNNSSGPENQIKDYIKQNINDPASYEPVSFGEKQTDSTKYTDDGYFNMLDDSMNFYEDLKKIYVNGSREQYDSVLNIQSGFAVKESAYLNNYKNRPDGYKILHIFRRKNKAGGIVLDSIDFRFDSSMKLRDFDYKKQLNKD